LFKPDLQVRNLEVTIKRTFIINPKIKIMQDKPGEMTTVTSVLETLRLKKQDNEFKFTDGGFSIGSGKIYTPEDLKIIKVYRFEGESDPSDMSVIYVIKANDGLVGYSMDAYGVYSDHEDATYDDFIRKIPTDNRDEKRS
jgi:hypothetical protein